MPSTASRWVHLSPREGCILEETLQWKYGLPIEERETHATYSQEIIVRNHGHYVPEEEAARIQAARCAVVEQSSSLFYLEAADRSHDAIQQYLDEEHPMNETLFSLLAEHLVFYSLAKEQAELTFLQGGLSDEQRRTLEDWRNRADRWDVYDTAWDRTAAKIEIERQALYTLTIDEVLASLLGEPLPRNIEQRINGIWSLVRQGAHIELTLEDKRPMKGSSVTELKGMVAYRGGVVRGIVGQDIIVAPMTTPNMITEIKNARAVVTDAGGILSHAAIFCREFHIPCIIGTNRATHAFHDGDEIEVDTNTGIVRAVG